MSGQRKAAIVIALSGTALFVLGWLGLSGVLPNFAMNPADVITGGKPPATVAASSGDLAGDAAAPETSAGTSDQQTRAPQPAPWWQFGGDGDGDHHEREHHERESHDDGD